MFMPALFSTGPADRLALFLNALVKAVADTFPKGQAGQLVLWQRLMRLGARFTAILTSARNPRPEKPPSRPQASSRSNSQPKPPADDFGLLFSQLPGYQRYRSRFEHLLQQPDIAELLQTNPQLRRVLNPLCRMLQLEPLQPQPPQPQSPGPQSPGPQSPGPQTPWPQSPGPQTPGTEPDIPPARRESQAEPRLTPGLLASPSRTRKAPQSCGPPPPSLWSCILRELARRKTRATKAEPAKTG
jgi:hypothetical protein